MAGGLLNNNGSHLLDHALQLLPDDVEPEVFADLKRVLSLGDTEDHVKIVLTAPGQPTIDVELSNASIFPQDRWLVLGTRGGLRGTPERLTWRTVDWDAHCPNARWRPRPRRAGPTTTTRSPGRSTPGKRRLPDPDTARLDYHGFYTDLYRTIRHDAPLVITPQSVRRLIVHPGPLRHVRAPR